ncbi:MAG: thiamine diphosphokinase [Promethearchaeota archaeon]
MKIFFLIAGSPEVDIAFLNKIKTLFFLEKGKESKKKMEGNLEIYAIDKGLEVCNKLQITVDKIIGDFDSVDPTLIEKYPSSIRLKYPTEKNESDTEIAIDETIKAGADKIIILNATGGRLDHLLFNTLLLLKSPEKIQIWTPEGILLALPERDVQFPSKIKLNLPENTTFSLIPIGECPNVSLKGAKYPLNEARLNSNNNPSLTLSNIVQGNVSITKGPGQVLLFISMEINKNILKQGIELYE